MTPCPIARRCLFPHRATTYACGRAGECHHPSSHRRASVRVVQRRSCRVSCRGCRTSPSREGPLRRADVLSLKAVDRARWRGRERRASCRTFMVSFGSEWRASSCDSFIDAPPLVSITRCSVRDTLRLDHGGSGHKKQEEASRGRPQRTKRRPLDERASEVNRPVSGG